ncbi:MAG: hypothetical protein R3B99_26990 [Polyangiales bacterium]
MLALFGALACKSESYTSPIDTQIPVVGGALLCLGREGVDTFVLDVLAIEADGVEPPSLGSLCSLCGRDPRVRCELLARDCRCGAALVDPRAIDEAFTGLRFEDLPDDRTLCARMVLANRGVGGGEPTACADLPTCDVNVDDVELLWSHRSVRARAKRAADHLPLAIRSPVRPSCPPFFDAGPRGRMRPALRRTLPARHGTTRASSSRHAAAETGASARRARSP